MARAGVGDGARLVDARPGVQLQAGGDIPVAGDEGPDQVRIHVGDGRLRGVVHFRHHGAGIPVAADALDADVQPLHRHLGLEAQRLGLGVGAHAVAARRAQPGKPLFVGHPVLDLGGVGVDMKVADEAGQALPGPVDAQAVGVVPGGVHQQPGIEDQVGFLPGIGDLDALADMRGEVEFAPGGADVESPGIEAVGDVIGGLGEQLARPVPIGIGPAHGETERGGQPFCRRTKG